MVVPASTGVIAIHNRWKQMTQCHKRARILPVWGEFLKRGEKGEEKKELDRGLHIFTSIACSVSSRVKARFFSQWSTRKARKSTRQQQETENFLMEMTFLLRSGALIVFICIAYLLSRNPISTPCLSICTWLIVGFDAVVDDDCIVTIHPCRYDRFEFWSP